MEISQEQIESLAAILAYMRLRPGMYISNDAPAIQNYLYGFQAAFSILGCDVWKGEAQIWVERGWEVTAMHPIRQMQEKGMSDHEVTVEVLTMLLLTLLHKYEIPLEPILKMHNQIRETLEKMRLEVEEPGQNSIYRQDPKFAEWRREQITTTLKDITSLERDLGINNKDTE
jgi:hypothetical protein